MWGGKSWVVGVRIDGSAGVFRLERDVVHFVPIEPGDSKGQRVAVESGLDGGERIVFDPPARLADGDRVRVSEE